MCRERTSQGIREELLLLWKADRVRRQFYDASQKLEGHFPLSWLQRRQGAVSGLLAEASWLAGQVKPGADEVLQKELPAEGFSICLFTDVMLDKDGKYGALALRNDVGEIYLPGGP